MPKATRQTGPKSAAGKARSSQNARKHGLTAKTPALLAGPEKTAFRAIQKQLAEEYAPQGPLEEFCCVSIAMLMQKQMKIWESEMAAFELASLPKPPAPTIVSISTLPDEIEQEKKLLSEVLSAIALPDDLTYIASALRPIYDVYPRDALPEKVSSPDLFLIGDSQESAEKIALTRLAKQFHPFGYIPLVIARCTRKNTSRSSVDDAIASLKMATEKRLGAIAELEASSQIEQAAAAEIEAQRRSLEQQSIPEQIDLITRYQTATSNELEKAIARLTSLQQRRLDTHHEEFLRARMRRRLGEGAKA